MRRPKQTIVDTGPDNRGRPRRKVTLDTGPGITEQAHKSTCDINLILRNYERNRILTHVKQHEGVYDDIPATDFQQAMITVTAAQQTFDSLPASMRKEFDNDPGKFLAHVQDPANRDWLAKNGMLAGNDGLTATGAPSGAPTETPSAAPAAPPAEPPAAPAASA